MRLSILAVIGLVFGLQSYAEEIDGAGFAEGRVIEIVKLCNNKAPGKTCKTMSGIRVTVDFYLGGCLDGFGGHSRRYDTESNTLYVSGIRLSNPDSGKVRCKRQPTQRVSMTVYNGHPDMEVVFLDKE